MNRCQRLNMLRTFVRLTPNFIIPIFRTRNENDNDIVNMPLINKEPINGWDRVKAMFKKNEYEEISVELHSVVQSSIFGAFIGACFGGFIHSRDAYLYFIENNQATIFKSTVEAKKKLQDHVTVAFAKGAYKWGWKLGIFTGMFSLLATTASVYRGDNSLMDYITAGTITGALYKAHLGAAATLVGAGLGAVLSALAGISILMLLKVTGLSMADIRQALYSVKKAREDQFNQVKEKSATIKNDDLTRHHDRLIEEKGEQKITEI